MQSLNLIWTTDKLTHATEFNNTATYKMNQILLIWVILSVFARWIKHLQSISFKTPLNDHNEFIECNIMLKYIK